jgi:hypothetical protein
MEQEAVALAPDIQVVDPDVRGYVYSLVTAVCVLLILRVHSLTRLVSSSEASMAKMRTVTCWVMTPWHVCVISSDG